MARRLRVHHWVACLESRVVPPAAPNNFYDLLGSGMHTSPRPPPSPRGSSHVSTCSPGTSYVGGRGARDFEIRVVWVDAPERNRLMDTYGPYRVTFRPAEPTRDTVFRLLNVPADGVGRYRIELYRITRRKRLLAAEYLSLR